MFIQDILSRLQPLRLRGKQDGKIGGIAFDSRSVKPGDLFVAVPGTQVDGHNYISQALQNGAVAVICEKMPDNLKEGVSWIQVKDSSKALALAASAYYDDPSRKIRLAGVTGTNGKTTVVTLLYQLFKALGFKTGMISTIKMLVDEDQTDAHLTTPDVLTINRYLKEMVDAGCSYAFMEVSSHAIQQNRVYGLDFDLAMFSNITHDHLDYHKTFAEYVKAKKRFFDELPVTASVLVNLDDRNGSLMVQNTKAAKYGYALKKAADFKAKVLENSFEGLQLDINGRQVWSGLVGDFNACNLLLVYGAARLLGQKEEDVLVKLSLLRPAVGRFEVLRSVGGKTAIVDYAHTPDALENVVKTISSVKSNAQKLIIVIGAGGDRDKTKRPLMGKIAANFAEKVIFTSDNPRGEDPAQIIEDMKTELPEEAYGALLEITDRKQAIYTACMLATNNDIVLVAGKGHETYQEVKGVRHHFDDKEIIRSVFKQQ
ncbi:MAG: UDP-N-acetylmuramoyl-L-alanyl-D-glutamate--2,6-diaminopimelate ligase [Bacteroidales bacterium]